MANAILNFHFDFPGTSLILILPNPICILFPVNKLVHSPPKVNPQGIMMFEGTENIFWPYVNGTDVALMSGETMHKIMMVVSLRTAEGTPVATLPQQRGPGFLLRKKRPRKSEYIAATNL